MKGATDPEEDFHHTHHEQTPWLKAPPTSSAGSARTADNWLAPGVAPRLPASSAGFASSARSDPAGGMLVPSAGGGFAADLHPSDGFAPPPPPAGLGFAAVAGDPSDAMRQQAAAQLLQHAANMSDDPSAAVARMTPTMPRLDVGIARQMPQASDLLPSHVGPGPADVRLGQSCEAEIDRLVKERLCGRFTDRTSMGRNLKRDHSDFYDTPLGRLEEAARGAGQALRNGMSWGSGVLLGRLHTIQPPEGACTCKRVQQSVPVYIFEDDDPALDGTCPAPPPSAPAPTPPVTGYSEDGFGDLISAPVDAGDPGYPGRSELAFPPDAEGRSRDEADGGDEGADGLAPLPNLPPGTKKKKQRRPGDTSSALSVSSSMTSSAASLLGGVLANQAGGLGSASGRSRPAKAPGDAQSSIGASAEPALSANDSGPPALAPRVPVGGAKGSKSVIAGGISTSSKSGALLAGMVSQDAKSSIGGGGGRKGGSKSVIAGMSGNTSSSAQLLAGLGQPKSGGGSAAAEGDGAGAQPKEAKTMITSGSKGGGGSTHPKPKGDSKTVISGMQSNSNAASLLSGLVQQQGKPKKKPSSSASMV